MDTTEVGWLTRVFSTGFETGKDNNGRAGNLLIIADSDTTGNSVAFSGVDDTGLTEGSGLGEGGTDKGGRTEGRGLGEGGKAEGNDLGEGGKAEGNDLGEGGNVSGADDTGRTAERGLGEGGNVSGADDLGEGGKTEGRGFGEEGRTEGNVSGADDLGEGGRTEGRGFGEGGRTEGNGFEEGGTTGRADTVDTGVNGGNGLGDDFPEDTGGSGLGDALSEETGVTGATIDGKGEEFSGLTVLVVVFERTGEFPILTIGRAVGATKFDEPDGDDNDCNELLLPPRVARFLETKGELAEGLGVELKDELTTGFKRPGAGKVKFCFCDSGNKTDDLVDIFN